MLALLLSNMAAASILLFVQFYFTERLHHTHSELIQGKSEVQGKQKVQSVESLILLGLQYCFSSFDWKGFPFLNTRLRHVSFLDSFLEKS